MAPYHAILSNGNASAGTAFSKVVWSFDVSQAWNPTATHAVPIVYCAPNAPGFIGLGSCGGTGGSSQCVVPALCYSPPPTQPQIVPPASALRLWNGTGSAGNPEYDPAFVGEYVNTFLSPAPYYAYRDWRLLPGSGLQNLGIHAAAGQSPTPSLLAQNGTRFNEALCDELRLFDLDGEGWGNPRVVGGEVDVGFDEVHGLIMAGNWSNDSISHNLTTPLSVSAQQGSASRTLVVPPLFAGVTLSISATQRQSFPILFPLPGWSTPPAALSSLIVDPTLNDPDFRTRFINLSGPLVSGIPPTVLVSMLPTPYSPLSGATPQLLQFAATTFVDVEPPLSSGPFAGQIPARYLNIQGVFSDDFFSTHWTRWTNLQFEYR